MKKCSRCKIEKNVKEFTKSSSREDGLQPKCKKCVAEYYEENKEKIVAQIKQYQKEHKEEKAAYDKQWYEENKEEVLVNAKQWYEEHKEEKLVQVKQYQEEHKEERAAYIKQYKKERLKNDPVFRLKESMRSRLRVAIKNGQKFGSAVSDLGCSINFFKGYIEAQWYANPRTGEMMSWENYGMFGWHLDHRLSLSSFDLSGREQFLKACHFSNLQPLWWFENLSKGNKC